MSRTVEVPVREWKPFFQTFSTEHQGWVCTMEVLGESLGAQLQSTGLPLSGIDAEVTAAAPRITVALGEKPDAHLTHAIDGPEQVRWMHADDGAEVVEVVSHDLRTLLRLHA